MGARWAALLMASGAIVACRDDDPKGIGRLPLPGVALPALTCRVPVEPAGECERDADCGSERCVFTSRGEDRVTPALTCGAAVGTAEERARCDLGTECESGLCALAGVCASACSEDADCAVGQVCTSLEVRVAEGLAPVMACTRASAFLPDVTLHGPARGSLATDTLAKLRTESGPGSSITLLKTRCDLTPTLVSVVAQDTGEELYDLEDLLNGRPSPNPLPASGEGALLSLLVPNNPRVTASSVGYDLTLIVPEDTPADVVAASRERRGKVLDLNLFYVGAGENFVAGGFHPGEPRVRALLERLRERYDELGIELGAIREYDVTGALRDEYAVIELDEVTDDAGNVIDIALRGVTDLFALSAGVDDGGINVFLVSDMGPVLGISGGIPGPLGVHGSTASGVAIALDVVGLANERVLMHELSHHMGLFHTSEVNGAVIEPLSDTASCGPELDANGDGQLSPAECTEAGADNLMFWAAVASKLSAQQREILRSSIVLR